MVIIDEYDKIKLACRPADAEEGYEDRTADEILKSIISNGKYSVGSETVDCSRILFFITTNETREQLEANFGYNGARGGGIQRLNVVEFERLDKDCCKRIINDMVKRIRSTLTDTEGDHRLRAVHFSEETLDRMADYIYNDHVKQGRAQKDLSDRIYSLFCYQLGRNANKEFEVTYRAPGESSRIGRFAKREVSVGFKFAPTR